MDAARGLLPHASLQSTNGGRHRKTVAASRPHSPALTAPAILLRLRFPILAVLLGALAVAGGLRVRVDEVWAPTVHAAAPPRIELPEMLAIELPTAGMTSIAPGDSPLKELLESASAPGLRITHDVRSPLPLGATYVTWTGWSGTPGGSSQAPVTADR